MNKRIVIFSSFFYFIINFLFLYAQIDIHSSWLFVQSKNDIKNILNTFKNGKGKRVNLPHKYLNKLNCKGWYGKKIDLYPWKSKQQIGFLLGKVLENAEIYIDTTKINSKNKIIHFPLSEKFKKGKHFIIIKTETSTLFGGFSKGPFYIDSYNKILRFVEKIKNKERIFCFFILGCFFIILIQCLSFYLNELLENEQVIFGIFVLLSGGYFILDILNFHNLFLHKLLLVIMFSLPTLILIFIFQILKIKIPFFIKLFIIFSNIILGLLILHLNDQSYFLKLKSCWYIISLISIIISIFYSYKRFKKGDMPELINAIIGLIMLGIFLILYVTGVFHFNGFKYGILLFIFFVLHGFAKKVSKIDHEFKKFPARLIQERDNERKVLVKELHDGLGQILVAAKLNLHLNQKKINGELLKRNIDDISTAIEELRRICESLKPAVLEKMGLGYAIKHYLEKYGKIFNITFINELKNEKDIPENYKENIFRIFQECLNNALKHSKASNIFVSLKKYNNAILFQFKDNGIGFNEQKIKKGIGLLSIKERVNIMKGSFNIKSNPLKGVSITVKIPLIYNEG